MDTMRLGFPVKVLGQPGLKSHDTRRWQNHPHLSVSLAYLRDILVYLDRQNVHMYRMASDLAPYVTHPDMPWFHGQIDECATELTVVGEMVRSQGVRLSYHQSLSTVLNAEDEAVARHGAAQITAQARILESMGLGPEAIIVTHVGGVYGDKESALERFAERYRSLPDFVRRRLAVENDDRHFCVADVVQIHHETGVPLVFDHLHLRNHNPQGIHVMEALELCLQTWPRHVKPKVHFSSPRTAMRLVERKCSETGEKTQRLRAPRPSEHDDFIDPFEFVSFIRTAKDRNVRTFDVMLEAKAKDLAVLHLRKQVARFAPEIMSD